MIVQKMTLKSANYVLSLCLAGLMIGCNSAEPVAEAPDDLSVDDVEFTADETLVLGDISNNPTKKVADYMPLADYLESRLTDTGIKAVKVKIAPDLKTMESWIAEGEVDLYFDSPYPAMIVSTNTGAEPLLRRWKKGVAEYSSLIFVSQTSEIQTIEELDGQRIALESDFSTSGYMLPLVSLQAAGLELVEQSANNGSIGENEVAFVFSADESNTVELVVSGKTDAGAIDSGTFDELPDEIQASMKVIFESEMVARHIVLAGPELPAEQVNAIKNQLLAMDQSPEGNTALDSFENTTKFDEFPVEQSIGRLKELYRLTLE
ncbi:MAG: phosphate/phosphite/phosphonate ABC transporter substrate-binding protein [Cyanobacteria bacterium P01_C01_bin.120]